MTIFLRQPLAALMGGIFFLAAAAAANPIPPRLAAQPPGPQSQGRAVPRSAIKASEQILNLGTLLPNSGVLARRVKIANLSPRAIVVTKVITSCGCTEARLFQHRIAGGSSALLSLHVAIRPWAGPEEISVALAGRRGGKPWHKILLVRYRVRRMLRVALRGVETLESQEYLDLGTLRPRFPALPALSLARGGFPAKWDRLECLASGKRLATRVRRSAPNCWLLKLSRTRPFYLGSQSCVLRFSFFRGGRKLAYRLHVPVDFRVNGPVDLVPHSLFFGLVAPGRVAKAKLRIWTGDSPKAEHWRITAALSSDPASVKATVAKGGMAVIVIGPTAAPPGRFAGSVRVDVSDGIRHFRFLEDYLGYSAGKLPGPPTNGK